MLVHEGVIVRLKFLLSLELLQEVAPYAISEVEEEAEHFAEIITAHLRGLTVHVRIVVENLQQIVHLNERILVPWHIAASERSQDGLDHILGVLALRISLKLD